MFLMLLYIIFVIYLNNVGTVSVWFNSDDISYVDCKMNNYLFCYK